MHLKLGDLTSVQGTGVSHYNSGKFIKFFILRELDSHSGSSVSYSLDLARSLINQDIFGAFVC